MIKPDVPVKRWSSERRKGDCERRETLTVRVSPTEFKNIEDMAFSRHVRTSDLIRGALIYAGILDGDSKQEAEP